MVELVRGEMDQLQRPIADHDETLNRKRKDQNSDDEENGSEGNGDNEDPATQKKQRVVWSKELHGKFVDAFSQLGPEKAFPKKILDLMNVEGLTRENVASHLQKYRLFLKRLHAPSNQSTSMATALGGRDYLDGYGAFHTLGGLGKYRGATPLSSSYQPGPMLGRLNTASGLSMRGIPPSTLIRTAHTPNTNNSLNALGRFPSVNLPTNQTQPVGLAQQLDQLHQNKGGITHVADFKPINSCAALDLASSGMPNSSMSSSFLGPSSNSLVLHGNQSSFHMLSTNFEQVGSMGTRGSDLLDYHKKLNGNWPSVLQSAVPLASLSNSIPAVATANVQNDQLENAFACAILSLEDSRGNMQGQDGLIGIQNMDLREPQRHQEHNPNSSNIGVTSTASSLRPIHQSLGQNGAAAAAAYTRNLDVSLTGWSNAVSHSTFMLQNEVQNSDSNSKMMLDDNYLLEEMNEMSRFTQNSFGSLEDIVGGFIKQVQPTKPGQ
ncbi:hypothetical protein Ancab_006737 [Ancistrocladus abbreviatus]